MSTDRIACARPPVHPPARHEGGSRQRGARTMRGRVDFRGPKKGQSRCNRNVTIKSSRFRHASTAIDDGFDSGTSYLYRVFTGNETCTQPVERANKTGARSNDYAMTSQTPTKDTCRKSSILRLTNGPYLICVCYVARRGCAPDRISNFTNHTPTAPTPLSRCAALRERRAGRAAPRLI